MPTNKKDVQAESPTERKPRKSVAFSEGATIVDSDGQVTESTEVNGGKNSAESHATGMRACTEYCEECALTRGTGDKEVDEVTDMFANLAKKKKKKSSKSKDEDEAPADDGDVDLSTLKKKKKSKKPKVCRTVT